MASILMPNDGTVKEWITSKPVTCTRTTLLTGTTISLSTERSLGWPGFRSLSGWIRESNSKSPLSGLLYFHSQVTPVALMVRSAGGVLSWTNRMRNDGRAMMTRMTTGITVHNTSTNVLWVVRDGVGLALALNFTITVTSNARTNTVMPVMIPNRKE